MRERGAVVDPRPPSQLRSLAVVGAADKDAVVRDVGVLLAASLVAAYTHPLAIAVASLETFCPIATSRLRAARPGKGAGQTYPVFTASTPRIAVARPSPANIPL